MEYAQGLLFGALLGALGPLWTTLIELWQLWGWLLKRLLRCGLGGWLWGRPGRFLGGFWKFVLHFFAVLIYFL